MTFIFSGFFSYGSFMHNTMNTFSLGLLSFFLCFFSSLGVFNIRVVGFLGGSVNGVSRVTIDNGGNRFLVKCPLVRVVMDLSVTLMDYLF